MIFTDISRIKVFNDHDFPYHSAHLALEFVNERSHFIVLVSADVPNASCRMWPSKTDFLHLWPMGPSYVIRQKRTESVLDFCCSSIYFLPRPLTLILYFRIRLFELYNELLDLHPVQCSQVKNSVSFSGDVPVKGRILESMCVGFHLWPMGPFTPSCGVHEPKHENCRVSPS